MLALKLKRLSGSPMLCLSLLPAILSFNGISNILRCPILERLWKEPDNIGPVLAPGILQTERQGMVAWRSMTAQVTMAAEFDFVLRKRLLRRPPEVRQCGLAGPCICVTFHLLFSAELLILPLFQIHQLAVNCKVLAIEIDNEIFLIWKHQGSSGVAFAQIPLETIASPR